MQIAKNSEEHNIDQQESIFDQLSIPKFFKLSFKFMLENHEITRKYFKKLLHITKGSQLNECGARWPSIMVLPGDKIDLYHAFQCLDSNDKPYRYHGNEDLSIGKWHLIEYLQLPVPNSSIAEIIIRINGIITHKFVNRIPERYDNMKV